MQMRASQALLSVFISVLYVVCCRVAWANDPSVISGYGAYREFGDTLYVAALHQRGAIYDDAAPDLSAFSRMEYRIASGRLSSRRFGRMLVSSTAINNAPSALASSAEGIGALLGAFKGSFRRGDHLNFSRRDDIVEVELNGIALAQIESPDLFDLLLNTWIGSVPPSREFKSRLLGRESADTESSIFYALDYPEARATDVLAWVESSPEETADVEAPEVESTPPEIISQDSQPQVASAAVSSPEVTGESAITPTGAVSSSGPELADVPGTDELPQTTEPEADITTPPVNDQNVALQEPEEVEEQPSIELASYTNAETLEEEDTASGAEEFSVENVLLAQRYTSDLLRYSQRNISYPKEARLRGLEGTVIAMVTIDRKGKLLDVELTEKSNHNVLNSAVKRGVKRAAPYPSVPDEIAGDSYNFSFPVNFQLR